MYQWFIFSIQTLILLFSSTISYGVNGINCYTCISDFIEYNEACLKRDYNNIEKVKCKSFETCASSSGIYHNYPSVWMGCKEHDICDNPPNDIKHFQCSTCNINLCNGNKLINNNRNITIININKNSNKQTIIFNKSTEINEKNQLECYYCINMGNNINPGCQTGKDMTIIKCNGTQICGIMDGGEKPFARGCGDINACDLLPNLKCKFCTTNLCNSVDILTQNSLVTLCSLVFIILKFVFFL